MANPSVNVELQTQDLTKAKLFYKNLFDWKLEDIPEMGYTMIQVGRVPIYVIVIPFLWSLLGVSAAISLGVKEDFSLVVAGIVGTILILINNHKREAPA